MIRLYALAILTVLVGSFVSVACERVPLTSPTGSTISVTIDQTTLPLNGQATVRAIVIESAGTPVHNGTQVNFSTSLGSFNPAEAATVNGVATTTFLAGGISGTTKINAYSGGASTGSGNSSSGGVEVKIGAAAAGSLSLSATPPSVSQSGGTVTISALVMDPSNNPLPGVSVLFAASSGTLSLTTALSDANGLARTTLTTTQTATVTAIAGAAKGDVQVTVSTAPTVAIDAPATAIVGVPVAITITPQGGGGNSSPRQLRTVVVDFGDGTSETLNNITGSSGLTHTYQRAGGFTISARSTDVNGDTGLSSRAIVVRPAVLSVGVSASPQSGPAPFTSAISITATAADGAPAVQSVRAFINGEQVFSGTGSGSFAYRFGAPGTYTISVVATDTAGNEGRASTIVVAN